MIAEIQPTHGNFRKTVIYVYDKVIEGDGHRLLAGTLAGTTKDEVLAEGARLRTQLGTAHRKDVFHASLALPPGESLTDAEWARVAETYMRKLGYERAPWFAVTHTDTNHAHIHVVGLRYYADPKTGNTRRVPNWMERERSMKITAQLEVDLDLKVVDRSAALGRKGLRSHEIREAERTPNQDAPREAIWRALEESWATAKDLPDLARRLHHRDVTLVPNVGRTGSKLSGLRYVHRPSRRSFRAGQLGLSAQVKGLVARGIRLGDLNLLRGLRADDRLRAGKELRPPEKRHHERWVAYRDHGQAPKTKATPLSARDLTGRVVHTSTRARGPTQIVVLASARREKAAPQTAPALPPLVPRRGPGLSDELVREKDLAGRAISPEVWGPERTHAARLNRDSRWIARQFDAAELKAARAHGHQPAVVLATGAPSRPLVAVFRLGGSLRYDPDGPTPDDAILVAEARQKKALYQLGKRLGGRPVEPRGELPLPGDPGPAGPVRLLEAFGEPDPVLTRQVREHLDQVERREQRTITRRLELQRELAAVRKRLEVDERPPPAAPIPQPEPPVLQQPRAGLELQPRRGMRWGSSPQRQPSPMPAAGLEVGPLARHAALAFEEPPSLATLREERDRAGATFGPWWEQRPWVHEHPDALRRLGVAEDDRWVARRMAPTELRRALQRGFSPRLVVDDHHPERPFVAVFAISAPDWPGDDRRVARLHRGRALRSVAAELGGEAFDRDGVPLPGDRAHGRAVRLLDALSAKHGDESLTDLTRDAYRAREPLVRRERALVRALEQPEPEKTRNRALGLDIDI